jgi:curved DNA-binding protein CbpA
MKKIVDYRKLLGVTKTTELKEMKTIYRNLMKEWHPDKFRENDERAQEAEIRSKEIIEAYNFLVDIAPETIQQLLPEYTQTTTTANITDYHYKALTLKVEFSDGSSYEYYDVPPAMYSKMINSGAISRFARRNIFNSFVYRKVTAAVTADSN